MARRMKRLDWQRQSRWSRLERERQPARQRQSLERRQSSPRPKQVLLSPALVRGSFLFQIGPPPDKHLARVNEKSGYTHILRIRDCATFPSHEQEELRAIKSYNRHAKSIDLFLARKIFSAEGMFERVEKSMINSCGDSLPSRFGDMRERRLPREIRFLQFQHYGDKFFLWNRRGGGGSFRRMGKTSVSHGYDNIISTDNLLDAWKEFLHGKQKKKDVQEFEYSLIENISLLRSDLASGAYRHGSYTHFKIADPKPRDIHKASVRDRLVHHALYRILYPFFDRMFMADSYSCRQGKGTHRALKAFRKYAYQESKNHAKTVWVLKCDIRKFFASIDQQILITILRRHLSDECTMILLQNIIESFHSTEHGKGLPLGNLTSQLLVNIYMNEFDQFVKHTLKARYYIRYSDDFVFLSTNREWLESLLPRVRKFLHDRLALELHPQKVSLATLASGIDFLGWVHFPDHRILRTATKKRMFRRIAEAGGDEDTVSSYLGMLSHGNAHTLQQQIARLCKYKDARNR